MHTFIEYGKVFDSVVLLLLSGKYLYELVMKKQTSTDTLALCVLCGAVSVLLQGH